MSGNKVMRNREKVLIPEKYFKRQEDQFKLVKSHGQVTVAEEPKKTQEEYLQPHFILSMQS